MKKLVIFVGYKLHQYNYLSHRRLSDKSSRKILQSWSYLSVKTEWRVKNEIKHNLWNVALTSIHTSNSNDLCFDSGCSRHMTENSLFFTKSKECSGIYVTFSDGVKGKVVGKGNINRSDIPILNEVRLVEGLSTNLISISQRCD